MLSHWPVITLVAGAGLLGMLVGGDFGMAWDEPAQRAIGQANAQAFSGDLSAVKQLQDKDYGPLIEMLLFPLEGLGDERAVTAARHRACHLLFLAGVVAFYALIWIHFRSRALALAGVAMLLLHPHLYGQSFFNSKDVPALVLWISGMLATRVWLEHAGWLQALAVGLCLGFLTHVRLAGLLAAGIFVLLLAWRAARERSRLPFWAGQGATFAGAFLLALVGPWPFLWGNPPGRLLEAIVAMARFRWDGWVLYGGVPREASELPMDYLIVWFAATTPLIFVIFIIVGFFAACWKFLSAPAQITSEQGTLFEFTIVGALVAIAMLVAFGRPVIYDGWRHFFFLYGPLAFLGVSGLKVALEHARRFPWGEGVVWGGFAASCLSVGGWMIFAHPLQSVYFNWVVARKEDPIWRRMERDYWGTSFRLGLEWVARSDPQKNVRVSGWPMEPLQLNHRLLAGSERERLRVVPPQEPYDYFVTNWRGITNPEGSGTQVYRVILNDSEVLSVFRRTSSD